MTQKEVMQMIVSILLGAGLAIAAVIGWDINPRIVTVEPQQPSVVVLPPSEAGKTEVVVVPDSGAAPAGPAEAPELDFSAQALAGDNTNFSGGVEVDVNSSTVEGLDVDQTGTGDIAVFRDGGSAVWTLADGGGVSTSGAMDYSSTLNVDGAVTFNSTLDVDGNLTSGTGGITVADTINVTGAADFDNTLNVDGAVTFNSTLDVDGNLTSGTGAITIADALNTTGAVDFDSTLNVDNDTTLGADLNVTAQALYTVTMGEPITPTGLFMQVDVIPVDGASVSDVAAGSDGQLLIIQNMSATSVLTIDGTGGTIECKANVALVTADTLTLVYDNVNSVWRCLSTYDNS